mmetsp:Transcript_29665/g.51206  ORF Transcript_29665/g.51206 Transcript_29665/m.51206 type:complete len:110 (+) Transcript_29665:121-450(+)
MATSTVESFCLFPECSQRAGYNFEGGELRDGFCDAHKLEGMVPMKRERLKEYNVCGHDGCSTYSAFDYRGEQKKCFCGQHISWKGWWICTTRGVIMLSTQANLSTACLL